MSDQKIRAVVVDYGNVLTMPQDGESVVQMRKLTGLDAEQFQACYYGSRFDYDRGAIDSEGYWRAVLSSGHASGGDAADVELDGELVGKLLDVDVRSWTVVRTQMVEWVRLLKREGHSVAVLSNMPLDHARLIRSAFDWFELFDVQVLSAELGLAKPEPEIYRECIVRLGVSPHEALFIDDIEQNVAAARGVGMSAIQFSDTAALAESLREFPGIPLPRL